MIGAVVEGVAALAEGWVRIARTPRLRLLAAAPVAVAAGAFALGIWGGIELAGWAADRFLPRFEGLLVALRWIALGAGYAIAVIGSLVAAKTLVLPVASGPFAEAIAARIEAAERGAPEAPAGAPLAKALGRSVETAVYGLAVLAVALPLLLIPVAGPVLYLVPAAYVEALGALDATFSRRGLGLAEKRSFLRENLGAALGLGGAVLLVNMVPIVNLLAVPAAAAGGALLVLRKESPALAGRER